MTPGWKTTEFWAAALAILATLLGWACGYVPAEWATIAGSVASGLYAVSRGLTKGGQTNAQLRTELLTTLTTAATRTAEPVVRDDGGVHQHQTAGGKHAPPNLN